MPKLEVTFSPVNKADQACGEKKQHPPRIEASHVHSSGASKTVWSHGDAGERRQLARTETHSAATNHGHHACSPSVTTFSRFSGEAENYSFHEKGAGGKSTNSIYKIMPDKKTPPKQKTPTVSIGLRCLTSGYNGPYFH